jgi:hypothetical protein
LTAGNNSLQANNGGTVDFASYGVYQVNNTTMNSSFSGVGFGLLSAADMDSDDSAGSEDDSGSVPMITTGTIGGITLDSASGVYTVNANTGIGQFQNSTAINVNTTTPASGGGTN